MYQSIDWSSPETWAGAAIVWILISVFGAVMGLVTKRWPKTRGSVFIAFLVGWGFGFIGAAFLCLGWWLTDRRVFSKDKTPKEETESPNQTA